jgi:hypothetical protein
VRDGFFQVFRLSGCIDGKEGSSLSSSNVVGPRDVDGEVDDVVYVNIIHPAGGDGDVNNQLSPLTKRDVVIEECPLRNQMLVWSRQFVRVSAVIVQDCVCQVADCVRDDAPLVWARLSAEAQSEHHEEDSHLNKLCAGLHRCCRLDMTWSESGLEVDLGCKKWDVGEKLLSSHGPIDNPHYACAKHTREELFCLDAAVDGCAGRTFKALAVCQPVLLDNLSQLVNRVLFLDIHWSK